jgi:hypothetical protein
MDCCLDGQAIGDLALALIELVSLRTRKTRTVAQALSDNQWVRDITDDLSVTAMVQYLHLWDRL